MASSEGYFRDPDGAAITLSVTSSGNATLLECGDAPGILEAIGIPLDAATLPFATRLRGAILPDGIFIQLRDPLGAVTGDIRLGDEAARRLQEGLTW